MMIALIYIIKIKDATVYKNGFEINNDEDNDNYFTELIKINDNDKIKGCAFIVIDRNRNRTEHVVSCVL